MLKPGDFRSQAGDFDDPVRIYEIVQGRDNSGGVTRTPTLRWTLFAQFAPLGGDESKQEQRELAEIWAAFTISWHRSLIPLEGWLIERRLTSERFEVRSVQAIDRKVTLIHARMVR